MWVLGRLCKENQIFKIVTSVCENDVSKAKLSIECLNKIHALWFHFLFSKLIVYVCEMEMFCFISNKLDMY